MKKICIIGIAILLLVVVGLYSNKKTNFEKIINNSVVYIESINNEVTNSCSGFVYDEKDGKSYIVTAYHCVEDYNYIYVYNMSQNKEKGVIESYDLNNDIAILSIEDSLSLKKIKISNEYPNVGDNIFVIGTPLDINYNGTLTHGVISYINRKISLKKENSIITYNTFQIDASINSGSSGSVLVDSKGGAIGMVIIKDNNLDGVSFAISIEKINKILE